MSAIPERCVDGAPLLDEGRHADLFAELTDGWALVEGAPRRLKRDFVLADFQAALDLVNAIGRVAEDQNHHPDLALFDYRKVTVMITTHDADGVTMNDFTLARAIDEIHG